MHGSHFPFIGFFTQQIEKADILISPISTTSHMSRARTRQELDDLEERLSECETRLLQMNNSYETMQRHNLELTELRHVLDGTDGFLAEASERTRSGFTS